MNHGTRTTYVKGCRCAECQRANREYAATVNRRNNQIAWGVAQPTLIDSSQVKQHLKALQASGMGRRTIAAQSGVALTVIARLIGIDKSKPANKVRPETAAKLLALTPGNLADGSYTNSLGSRRRIQSLIAIGYTQTDLAKRLRLSKSNFGARLKRKSIRVDNAQAINDLWLELQATPGPSDFARAQAKLNRWATPLAWDNIDTDSRPPKVEIDKTIVDEVKIWRKRAGENLKLTRAEIHAATELWLREGISQNEIDRILNQAVGSANIRLRRAKEAE